MEARLIQSDYKFLLGAREDGFEYFEVIRAIQDESLPYCCLISFFGNRNNCKPVRSNHHVSSSTKTNHISPTFPSIHMLPIAIFTGTPNSLIRRPLRQLYRHNDCASLDL